MKKIPKKYAPMLFSILLSFFMGLIMSGIVTYLNQGFSEHYIKLWLSAFIRVWPIALVLIYFIRPAAVKIVEFLTEK